MTQKLGELARKRRLERGLTQVRVAALAGIHQSHLARFELGKSDLAGRNIQKLFEILGSPIDEMTTIGVGRKSDPDADLGAMDPATLLTTARTMRAAIRAHRDATGHDLCWHQPDMWALLPDPPKGGQVVPAWPQFLRGCLAYRAALDRELAGAPRSQGEFGE